jgi:hypothetical protein
MAVSWCGGELAANDALQTATPFEIPLDAHPVMSAVPFLKCTAPVGWPPVAFPATVAVRVTSRFVVVDDGALNDVLDPRPAIETICGLALESEAAKLVSPG